MRYVKEQEGYLAHHVVVMAHNTVAGAVVLVLPHNLIIAQHTDRGIRITIVQVMVGV